MLNRKSIERALARAAGHQDESVVARLALFAPALLKAADLRAQLAAEAPEWTDEEIEAARLGKETLLSLRPVTIDSERFLQTVDAIAAAFSTTTRSRATCSKPAEPSTGRALRRLSSLRAQVAIRWGISMPSRCTRARTPFLTSSFFPCSASRFASSLTRRPTKAAAASPERAPTRRITTVRFTAPSAAPTPPSRA